MAKDEHKLISLFERKINLLLEKNEGYSRFKGRNLLKMIRKILSKELLREDIMDLGFLLHLYALNFKLTMYKSLTPFTMLSFKKDLQDMMNALHAYQRHRNPQTRLSFELPEVPETKALLPPFVDVNEQGRMASDNPELYNEIFDMLEGDLEKVSVEIPKDIIKEMQHIDIKKIYKELPRFIEKKKNSTIRKLSSDFPVFENDRLALVTVFNEVLFLANEGKVFLKQLVDDVGISPLMK